MNSRKTLHSIIVLQKIETFPGVSFVDNPPYSARVREDRFNFRKREEENILRKSANNMA